jgi:hypothetical protein
MPSAQRLGTRWWFGVPPARVDLLKSAGEVEFDRAYERSSSWVSDGLTIPVVGLDDLIAMKRSADRDQDRVDVKRLERRLNPSTKPPK